jgi:hypothetical protein
MKRTGLETQQRTRRGRTLAWPVVASVLVALAMLLRGMLPSETPEAIPPAPKLLPMRRATSSPPLTSVFATPIVDTLRRVTAPSQRGPEIAATLELPERLRINPSVAPDALSYDYPGIASDLLHFVKLAPNGGGGFLVQQVDPDSMYHALGLQAGDVIYSTDPPPNSNLDVTFLRAEVKLEVFRDGQSVWLSYTPDAQDAAPAEPTRALPSG